jgi:hypothetical protein
MTSLQPMNANSSRLVVRAGAPPGNEKCPRLASRTLHNSQAWRLCFIKDSTVFARWRSYAARRHLLRQRALICDGKELPL